MKKTILLSALLLSAWLSTGCTLGLLGYFEEASEGVVAENNLERVDVTQKIPEETPVNNDVPLIGETQEIGHDYDLMVTLGWGADNDSDLDLSIYSTDLEAQVNYEHKIYQIDDNRAVWLDYDYTKQGSKADPEVVTVLGMADKVFKVNVLLFNGVPLKENPVLTVQLPNGEIEQFNLDKDILNANQGLTVCMIRLADNSVEELMQTIETVPGAPKN